MVAAASAVLLLLSLLLILLAALRRGDGTMDGGGVDVDVVVGTAGVVDVDD